MRSPEDILINKLELTQESTELLRLFKMAFNSSPEASAIIDNSKILLCNPAFNLLFGYKANENFTKRDINDFISSSHKKDFNRKLGTIILENTISHNFESKGLKHNSKEFDVQVIVHSEKIAGNTFTFLSFRDITDKKSLQQHIQKLSYVIENSSSMVILTNADGWIEYTNTKFTETTGYYFEEVFGKKIVLLGHEEVSDIQENEIWNLVRHGNNWRGEIKNKKKSGDEYWESVFISPIMDENGSISHFLILKDDLTFKKEIELELKRALDCAEEANKLKFNLLSNM
ncbi:MAG: PAS domain S-box protein, partial [Melioribacter sp.]|nr:PAS domain S-box protein [Melioribacter sp.]